MEPRSRAISVPNLRNIPCQTDELPSNVCDNAGVTYEVGKFLGKGGFAKCFLASSDGQEFALKVIAKQSIKRPSHLNKIRKEILTHYSLRHPNIVALYTTFEDLDFKYMLLEYCPNRTLADYIELTPGRFINEANSLVFLKQLLKAVKYLHSECGILHRDIKPGNILLSREYTVKLADFGFCCSIKELEYRISHTVCGTPNYVPVEVIEKIGHSIYSESWAIACTFYCMIYGKPPFHSECLETTYSKIRRCDYTFPKYYPASLKAQDFIKKTLLKDRYKRMTVDAMLQHSIFSPISKSLSYASGLNNGTESANTRTCSSANEIFAKMMIQEKNKSALVDSGLGSEVLLGHACKFMRKVVEKYVECICLALDRLDPHCLLASNSELPASFVTKWVDYTNKFGFGATLRDGTRTLLFNDQSTISVTEPNNRFSYRRRKFDDERVSWLSEDGPPTAEITDKVELLCYLRDYMDKELFSFVKMDANHVEETRQRKASSGQESGDSTENQLYSSRRIARSNSSSFGEQRKKRSSSFNTECQAKIKPVTHLIDFRKIYNSLLMLLSDGTCQINFAETRFKLCMCISSSEGGRKAIQAYFVTAKHQVFAYEFADDYDSNGERHALPSEFASHLNSMQKILVQYAQFLAAKSPAFCSTDC